MNDKIKEILIKDFNEILVKEFCTDWKEKRLYIELLINSTPFSNLLDYITNLEEQVRKAKEYDKLQQKLQRKDNVINGLKKWCNECIENHIIARENGETTISDTFFEIVLDKIKELEK